MSSRRSRELPDHDTRALSAPYLDLTLAQAVLSVFAQRREQIADDAALAGPDLSGDGHPRRQIDRLVLDLHLGAVERDPRGIDRPLVVARRLGILRCRLRFVLCLAL